LVKQAGHLVDAIANHGISSFLSAQLEISWLLIASVLEAALLFAAAFVSIGFSVDSAIPPTRLYVVIVLIAAAMGLRDVLTITVFAEWCPRAHPRVRVDSDNCSTRYRKSGGGSQSIEMLSPERG
jgi:hypothetical protein